MGEGFGEFGDQEVLQLFADVLAQGGGGGRGFAGDRDLQAEEVGVGVRFGDGQGPFVAVSQGGVLDDVGDLRADRRHRGG